MCPFSAHRNATTVSGIVAPRAGEGGCHAALSFLSVAQEAVAKGRWLNTTERCVIDSARVPLSDTRHNAIILDATISVYSALRDFPQASL